MKSICLLLLSAILLCALPAIPQVKISYNSPQKITRQGYFSKSYEERSHRAIIPSKQSILQKEQQNERAGEKQFIIAVAIPSNIDVVTAASWINEGRYSYGKYTIHADSAKTLSLNFDRFYLPEGTELYIYNHDGAMIMGPISSSENNEQQIWGSAIYKGEDLNIEIKILNDSIKEFKLHISNIAYGYKQIFVDKTVGFGLSGFCNINVLCPLGTGWENERNSVALITNSDGTALCTGALIANTCNSNIPYFLTANHCYAASTNVASWRFQFQAWSATCTPNANSDGVLFNGSTLKANSAASDFALVQLNQTPGTTSGLSYAGWNRGTGAATQMIGIHHPRGDVMKISLDNNPTIKTAYLGGAGTTHWQVTWVNGVTEGGSSGSPLFDQNHRIVGQLHGGWSSCFSTDLRDWYGAFDVSWTGGGTNSTRLSNWLDPGGTGTTTVNTINVSALNPSSGTVQSVTGPTSLCSGTAQVIFNVDGATYTGPVSWTSSNPAIATVTPTGNPATVTKVGAGNVSIIGTITGGCPSSAISRSRFISVGVPPVPTITYTKTTTTDYIFTATSDFIGGYDWFIDGTQRRWNADGVTYWTIPCYQSISIYARQSNGCGSSAYSTPLNVYNWCTLSALQLQYTVYPNPASSIVTIQPAATAAQPVKISKMNPDAANGISAVRIFDGSGNIRKEMKLPRGSNKAQINVDDLQSGVYYVEISDGKNVERQKLVITGN